MASIKLKRSSIAGKVPDTADLALGELAVNTKDGKLFLKKSNGTESIVEIANISNPIFIGTIKADKLEVLTSSGDQGGEIFLAKAQTNTTINGGITIDVYQNKLRIFEQGNTARGVYVDLTAASAGVGTNLLGGTSTDIIKGTETLITNNPVQVVDIYNKALYRTVKYLLQAISGDQVQASEVTITHNDTSVFINQYGNLYTSSQPLVTLTATIDATNIYLNATPINTNTIIDFTRISIVSRNIETVVFNLNGDLVSQSGSEDLMYGSGLVDLIQ